MRSEERLASPFSVLLDKLVKMQERPSFEEATCRLWLNPLFHASLGSKELFHSNFLGWLCETYPEHMVKVFEQAGVLLVSEQARLHVPLREFQDLDLILRFEGFAPLVIENKVKAFPDAHQLKRYDLVVAKRFGISTKLLLTLVEPEKIASDWHVLTYARLLPALLEVATSLPNQFHSDLVRHWCHLLDELQKIVQAACITSDEEDYFMLDQHSLLRRYRLEGFVYRLRAQQLLGRIKSQIARSIGVDWHTGPSGDFLGVASKRPLIFANTNFTNDTALVDIHCRLPGKNCIVGVQVQGDTMRLFGKVIEPLPGLAKAGWKEKKQRWGNHIQSLVPHCFDFGAFDQLLKERGLADHARKVYPAENEFNGYEPDFVYRAKRLVASPAAEGRTRKSGAVHVLPSTMRVCDVVDLTVTLVAALLEQPSSASGVRNEARRGPTDHGRESIRPI